MRGTSRGHIIAWQGGSLWIGEFNMVTGLHAHHAIQVTLALEEHFHLRDASTESFGDELTTAILAANRPHALSATATVALIFLEPESTTGRVVSDLYCRASTVSPIPLEVLGDAPVLLLQAFRRAGGKKRMADIARQFI
ncbi:MAG TPA: hypothetical protein VIL69_19950, partial [Roseomonas sp.]